MAAMISADELLGLATHESAHFCMATLLGWTVKGIGINVNDAKTSAVGAVLELVPGISAADVQGMAAHQAASALAGVVGESIQRGDPHDADALLAFVQQPDDLDAIAF